MYVYIYAHARCSSAIRICACQIRICACQMLYVYAHARCSSARTVENLCQRRGATRQLPLEIYIDIYRYIYLYISIYIYTSLYISIHAHVYHTCTYISLHIYTYLYISIHTHTYIYTHTGMYIYMHMLDILARFSGAQTVENLCQRRRARQQPLHSAAARSQKGCSSPGHIRDISGHIRVMLRTH